MSRVCFLGTALFLVLHTPLAQAGERENQERAARKACLSGDYAKGVEILSELFLDTKNPTHIFNQARCYEQNNRCNEAVGRFREYLRKAPNLRSSERTDVERHIEECEDLLGKAAAPSPPAPAPAPVAAPLPPAPVPAAEPVAPAPVAPVPVQVLVPTKEPVPPAASASKGYGLLIGGIATSAVGVGAVVTGIYFYTRARYYTDQPYTEDNEDAGQRAETLQWVFYGVGGVALAAGTVMTILGWPSSEPSAPSTSFAPMVGPGLAGIAAQGTF